MLYLASASPRRSILLRQIGLAHEILPVNLSEARQPSEAPAAYVARMALEKAEAARARLPADQFAAIVGADTVVAIEDQIFGKPRGLDEAMAHLDALSGRVHEVLSAVAVVARETAVRLSRSQVWFRELTTTERAWYCATGEPLDKAGGYAIQGLGAMFIRRLEGSFSGVMGLPLFETAELLLQAGISLLDDKSSLLDGDP